MFVIKNYIVAVFYLKSLLCHEAFPIVYFLADPTRYHILRVYFKNHYGRKAIVNALQFKEMNSGGGGGISLSDNERKALDHTIIPLVTRT